MTKQQPSQGRTSRPITLQTLADIQKRVANLYRDAFESEKCASAIGWQKQTDELMADLDRRIEWILGQLFGPRLSRIAEGHDRNVDLLMQVLPQFARLQEMLGETDTLNGRQAFFLHANVAFMLMDELIPQCIQDLDAARSRFPTDTAATKKEYIFELTEDGNLLGKLWM